MIRVLDGPFCDFIGVVRAAPPEAAVVKVAVGVQGREVIVEIDRYHLEQVR